MSPGTEPRALAGKYEAALGIFLVLLAFLWRESAQVVFPDVLYLLGALLALNLAASRLLARWPARVDVAAGITLLNCGVVAAIVELSGGVDSKFWVLYLLPIESACLLLGRRETFIVTFGAIACNFAAAAGGPEWHGQIHAPLTLKAGVLALAALATSAVAERERALRRAVEAKRVELEQRVSAAGLETAGIIHDLNNALAVSLGYLELALADDPPEELRRELEAARRSGRYAAELTAGLLESAMPTASRREAFEVDDAVGNALALMRAALAQSMTACRVELPADLPAVLADRTQIQRLLVNLLGNAVKAMRKTGGTIVVRAIAGASRLTIIVEDDGPGLPAQVLARLFEPFTKGGSPDGHGLGLYVCAEMARQNGGTLAGENRPEGGARFSLTLPIAARGSVARPTRSAAGAQK